MNINDAKYEALKQSKKVFVISDMSVPSIRNTVRLCKMLQKFNISSEKIEIILNRFIKGGPLSLEEIEKNFFKKAYWLVPNEFADVISSINKGIPLVKLTPGSPFSKNILGLVKKVQGLTNDQNFRGLKGTFGKNI